MLINNNLNQFNLKLKSMKKKILALENVHVLSSNELKTIKGKEGEMFFCPCPDGTLLISEGDPCEVLIPLYCFIDM